MRSSVAVLICILVSTMNAQGQGLELKVEKASREVLVQAAALGNMQFIENQKLIIRLYGFSVPGDCIPGARQVCGHHYVLLTGSAGEAPVMRAYDLGPVGEITRVEFAGSQETLPLIIEMTVQNLSSAALKTNPRLAKRTRKVRLKLDENEAELVNNQ